MGMLTYGGSRVAVAMALALGAAAAVPMACAFPSYTYNLPGTGGSASNGSTGPGTMSMSSTTGTGAMTTASSGTGTSSSSTGGPPCASMNCSDPTCANSFKCVPTTPPTGWTGYFSLYDGPPSGVPSCGGSFPMTGFTGNGQFPTNPPPAMCPCSCGNPSGGTCQIPPVEIDDSACGVTGVCACPVTPPTPYTAGSCFNFPVPGMAGQFYQCGGSTCGTQTMMGSCSTGTQPCTVSAKVAAATVSGSTCAPSATMPMKPAIKWGSTGQACGMPVAGTGCGSTDTCLPIPGSPFVSGVCIMQTGNVQCPAGQFTDQHIFYSGTDDTRGCSACQCGPATGDTCTVSWSLYSDISSPPSCQSQQLTLNSGMCSAFSANPSITSAKATITGPPTGGMCNAIDGTPNGMVTPTGATTFCCIP